MNAHDHISPIAERHAFTGADVRQMAALDLFGGARVELLNGQIFDMASEGWAHQDLREIISGVIWAHIVFNKLPLVLGSNGPVRLSETQEPEPDIYVRSSEQRPQDVRGPDILIAIEISDTNHKRDFVIKPPIYAAHGVRDYWLIDLAARETIVRRGPRQDGTWAEQIVYPAAAAITPLLLPGLSLRIADYLPAAPQEGASS